MELKTSSSFKTTGLLQPWQTLCKIFSKCLTTRVTGWDQPLLQIMQMMVLEDRFPQSKRMMINEINIFNSGRYKDKVGMKIPAWMISEEMKHTEHSDVYGGDPHVLLHHLVPTVDKADEIILQDTLQVRVQRVIRESSGGGDYLMMKRWIHTDLVSSDTEKLQELTGRYGYLFEQPRAKFLSRKSFDTLADHLQECMFCKRYAFGNGNRIKKVHDKMIAKAMLQERGKLQAEISSQIQNAIDTNIPSLVDASVRSYMSGHILHVHPAQPQTTSVPEQQYQLYLSMKADPQLQQQDIAIWLALQMKFKTLQVPQTTCRTPAVRPRDQDDPHDDAHPEGENSAKRQKTSEYEAHVTGESSGQMMMNNRRKSYLKYHGRSVMTIKVAELRQLAYEMFETKIVLQEMSII
ncbi:hypothetical protein Tco_0132772 [Tanacetum coccineum]